MLIKETDFLYKDSIHTPLMSVALDGDERTVKMLIERGANVNARDEEGRTALMFATVNLHHEVVSLLLEHGADVNARAKDGGTALMLAASCGDIDIVQLLLERGADCNGCYILTGQTAALIATERGYTNIVELLKTATANKFVSSEIITTKKATA